MGDKITFEDVLEKVRSCKGGEIWESFFRVEYGIEWLMAGWEAFRSINDDFLEYMSIDEIALSYVEMINTELE